MARTNIPVNAITRAAVAVGAAASEVNGDTVNNMSFYNGDAVVLHVRNTDGSQQSVSVVPSVKIDGATPGAYTTAINAGGEMIIGPWNQTNWGPPNQVVDGGDMLVTCTSANLKFRAYRLGL